jgi:uncharacterized protein YdhG (YjbR/CyaY superfamily)
MADKNTSKKSSSANSGEAAVLEVIAAMSDQDRIIAERLHAIITENAPALLPRTWYGMPAYSNGGKVVCFFRSRQKFGERFMTLGFNDSANLDEGNMWPIYFAVIELTPAEKQRIAELVKRAAG